MTLSVGAGERQEGSRMFLDDVLAEFRTLNRELVTLNTNLEVLAVLLERYQGVPETLVDFRAMAASLLGWRVKEPKH